MRLIDADALIEFWKADLTEEERSKLHIPLNVAIENLRDAPTVDAVERNRGRWTRKSNTICYWYECSECGEKPLKTVYGDMALSTFCPWCGAEMRGEADDVQKN